jgi:hypothetical protein
MPILPTVFGLGETGEREFEEKGPISLVWFEEKW